MTVYRRSMCFVWLGILWSCFIAASAGAADSTWTGAINSDFNTAGNWTAGVPVSTAIFDTAGPSDVFLSSTVTVGTIVFNPNAPAHSLTITPTVFSVLNVDGTGMINNSSHPQTVLNEFELLFHNQSTLKDMTIENQGQAVGNGMQFLDHSSAGNAVIKLDTIQSIARLYFHDESSAANSTITGNQGQIYFNDTSSAGNSSITSNLGTIAFGGSAAAGNAAIVSNDTEMTFAGTSTADHAVITNNYTVSGDGGLNFYDMSSAGNAVITNVNGEAYTTFHDSSTADHATLINTANNNSYPGNIYFRDTSNAGSATIVDRGDNSGSHFSDRSSAGGATISNQDQGSARFFGSSSAGTSMITNTGGQVYFGDSATAGHATITNTLASSGNTILFQDNSSAANASLFNNAGGLVFADSSTAGNAVIATGNGAYTSFNQNSTGGNASLSTNLGGLTTISGLTSSGMTAGSIAGDGSYELGSKSLTVGGNNLSTSVTGVISGDGGSLVKVGSGTLTLTGANSYTGGTRVAAGTLEGNTVGLQGDILNQAVLSFNQNTDASFNNVISGTGTVVKEGSGALTLHGNNTYTGDTIVQEGALYLNGVMSGDATIANGAVLSNDGSFGNVINNGTLIPGRQGVGSLKASSYSGAGTLAIQFNNASNTSLAVAGNADLSGSALKITGTSFGTGSFDIVSAASLNGSFASVDAPATPFLTFGTDYTTTDAFVVISTNAVTFASMAQAANRQGVAAAMDTAKTNASGDFLTTLHALYALPASQLQSAYSNLSGDALASFQSAGLRSAALFANQMESRAAPAGSIATAELMTPIQIAFNGDIRDFSGFNTPSRFSSGVWSRGIGLFDHINADSSLGSPSSEANTGGFQAGYDHFLGDEFLVGVSGGFSSTSLSVSDRSSSGSSSAIQAGLYGSYTPAPWFFSGALGYTTASNSMTRTIAFPGIDAQANSSFKSHLVNVLVEGGYRFKPSQALSLEPVVSLQEIHLQQNGYAETGAPGLNLAVGSVVQNSVPLSLGLRLSQSIFADSAHPIKIGTSAAWQHELANTSNVFSAQFVDAPGNPFTVQGTPQSRDAATLGVGGRVAIIKNLQAFADYSVTLSSEENIQAIMGGLSLRW